MGKFLLAGIRLKAGIQSPATVVNSGWRWRSHFHPLGVPVATGMGGSREGRNDGVDTPLTKTEQLRRASFA